MVIALVGITAVGLFLRLYRLGELPFGFHQDEVANLLDAVRITQGWRPIYLTANNGREALLSYLIAGSISLFGVSVWSTRLVTAVGGALAIPAEFLLVQSLPLPRPRLTALVSAALVAFTFWPVAQARYALRSDLVPLWMTLIVWAWWQTVRSFQSSEANPHRRRRKHAVWMVTTGVLLAGLFYTHPNGRLAPLILAISAVWLLWRERRSWPLIACGGVLAVAGLLALPLIVYFVRQPDVLNYRVNQVSVFNPAVNDGHLLSLLANNARRVLLSPIVRGDSALYHNIPKRPVFVGLDALFFLVGVALLARDSLGRRGRLAQDAAVLIVAALGVTLASSWLSSQAPDFSRMTGAWFGLFLLTAWGLERSAWWLLTHIRRGASAGLSSDVDNRRREALFIGVVLAVSLTWNTVDYFVTYVNMPQLYDVFQGAAVERANHIADLVAEGPTYVTPVVAKQSVIQALTAGKPPESYDPRGGLLRPDPAKQELASRGGAGASIRYLFDPAESSDATRFGQRWPELERQDFVDRRGALSLIAFRLPLSAWPAMVPTGSPQFGAAVTLEGYQAEPRHVEPGGVITVTLAWRVLAPTATDINFFVHLNSESGHGIAQFDGPPLNGSLATTEWSAGSRILQSVEIHVPDDAVPGTAALRTGWYDWRTLQPLPVANQTGADVDLTTVEIVPRHP